MFRPSYIKIYKSGELAKRVSILSEKLKACTICPHQCAVDRRLCNDGFCGAFDSLTICSFCPHFGEEPPISGRKGSGTIFFGRCNLQCVYCQNADISQEIADKPSNLYSAKDLAMIMLGLQNKSLCHNINLVSPSHFIPQIVEAVYLAIPRGLKLPLVYNSNGYDSLETLKLLDGIIDIYLPDLKYADDAHARTYSGINNYVQTAREAIREMYRQVGLLKTDSAGIARRGLIIRHLVLPHRISGTRETLHWIAGELSAEITLSLMAQYYPAHKANRYNELNRFLSVEEYNLAFQELNKLGFINALYQEPEAAHYYRPDFRNKKKPFADSP